MAAGKVIGKIEVTKGSIKIVGVDGVVREPGYEGLLYENEQVISNDPTALFQIKFLALPEASAYDGVFRILADGSVIHGRDAMDSIASDEDLSNILETAAGDNFDDLETAAGEESAEGSSSFTPTNIVAESSVLGFNRGTNGELGFGITDFGGENVVYDLAQEDGEAAILTPPVIASPNFVIYDENGSEPVIQVEANGESSVSYSIAGLDSEHFTIDPQSGVVTFNESPDFENPKDLSGDNEYNVYVTATDETGNYTTQLLSVYINNLNDNIPLAEDGRNSATEDVPVDVSGQVAGSDADGNAIEFVLVKGLNEGEGTLVFNSDGSYTYNIGSAFQNLDEGETKNITFTYKAVEIAGSEPSDQGPFESTEATVTITITGAEDGAVISGTFVGAVAEDGTLIATGTLEISDVDTLDNPSFVNVVGAVGLYGIFTLTDGNWTYTLNNDAVQFLGDGESRQDTHTFTATDGSTQDVVITIAGAEDGPTIIVTATPGEIVEDSATQDTIVASFAADDVDSENSAMIYEITDGTDPNGYYAIDGSDVKLTAAGVAYVNGGGEELPEISVTVHSGGLSATDADSAPDIIPVADLPFLSMSISDEQNTVIDEEANEEAGIYLGGDGKYYQDTENVIEVLESSNGVFLNPGRFDINISDDEFGDKIDMSTDFKGAKISAVINFYNGDTLLNTEPIALLDGTNSYEPPIGQFDKIVFLITGKGSIHLEDYTISQTISVEVEPITSTSYIYTIDVVSGLSEDSEELSEVEINGIPDDAELVYNEEDGTYSFEVSQPLGNEGLDNITASVVSMDGDDEAVVVVNQNGIVSIEAGSGNDTLIGDEGDNYIDGGDGDDYIDGAAGADALYGGAGNDTIVYDALDTVIDGGEGFDTLIGHAETINLSNVSNIELIQLSSGATVVGNDGVSGINADDVISATGDDNTLYITSLDGSASDQVSVDTSSLFATGSVEIDGINYAQYSDGDATLLIQIEDVSGGPL